MLELPDAERGQQQTLGARQCSHRGHFSLAPGDAVAFPRTAPLPLRFSDSARGFTDWEVASIIHEGQKSSLRAMVFPLVRRSVLRQLARSCRLIENWGA